VVKRRVYWLEARRTGDADTDAMAALEQARAPVRFVPASTGPQDGNIEKQAMPAVANPNPDAIDIYGMDDD